MAEVKLTGNCLKGSRPLLSFDSVFDEQPHLQVIKSLFTQVFGSPKGHPKVKPFIDHVLSFFVADDRVWFRNYQIVYSTAESKTTQKEPVLVEIGPRVVLQPIKVFESVSQFLTEQCNSMQCNAPVLTDRLTDRLTDCLIDLLPRSGSFSGATLWENSKWISPTAARAAMNKKRSAKYVDRITHKKARRDYEADAKAAAPHGMCE
jgi:ribosome biogenesis protein BRX1